jgi:lipopolysaccharide transport system ATP-binding protein
MQPIIRIDNVGKQYRIGARQTSYPTLREAMIEAARKPLRWLRHKRLPDENMIWVLKDINLEIQPGEVVGVIGRNGAGKSTLLKILSRITMPTSGQVDLYGRVGSLLEVGAGFHPELTGRENVFLSGVILGMQRHEIRRKLDEIVDFADIVQFLDTPVKHYSSGMYTRLAFAVAAHLETEIILIDEVLAVGDTAFQKKCLGKMGEVAHQGRTVLFVSHQLSAVKALSSRAILLQQGTVGCDGDADSVVSHYLKEGFETLLPERVWSNPRNRPGNTAFRLCALRVTQSSDELRSTYSSSEEMTVALDFELTSVDRRLCVGFALLDRNGVTVFQSCHTDGPEPSWPMLRVGRNHLRCTIPAGLLSYGKYYVAPRVYLHSVEWVLNGDPEVGFEVQLDHGQSPLWASIFPSHFPGVIAPCLKWDEGHR